MTYRDAQDLAIKFGAKLPKFDHTNPAAQCWIDRIAYIRTAAERGIGEYHAAIAEANRYAA